MKVFTHVFNTWLWAHALHAILFTIFDYYATGSLEVGFFVAALLIGPIVSIPALLICWFLFHFLYLVQGSKIATISLWLLYVTVAMISNLLLFWFFEPFTILEGLQFIMPALLSGWTIILLRKNQLLHFFTSTEIENETNLV